LTAPPLTAPPVQGGLLCAECGKIFQPDEVIRVNDRWVCAACKPVFLQRVREGAVGAGAPPVEGAVPEEQVRARDYEHDISGYFGQAWRLFKGDPWHFIGASVLVYLCVGAANAIPYLSIILGIIFTGPLMGGLWMFYLKKIRGQAASVSDAFGGFGPRFGQLLLAHLIPGLLIGLCIVPVLIAFVVVGALFIPAMSRGGGGAPSAAMMVPLVGIGALFVLVALCGVFYLQTCWLYTLWLVADKHMTFWPAMSLSRRVVTKHWWMNFLLTIVSGLVVFAAILPGVVVIVLSIIALVATKTLLLGLVLAAGVLLVIAGFMVAGPVSVAAIGQSYERLFGDMQPSRG
ncbi:MAG: hypothetical protein HY301_19380, partial [Verrucomicrobia bacterium]|nr:hypothetical protein [Verrucomicrobiota bacterium]